jgi:putative sterol carrier protein
MIQPRDLTLRQMLEGMTLAFAPEAADGLDATIQFNVTGPEPGTYHVRIAEGDCTFHMGASDDPRLTITTPSDVWLKISRGELDGGQALMKGLYQAEGDLSLLLQMGMLFGSEPAVDAPFDQRPPGPLALSGMTWMMLAFVPWMIHWITFDIPEVGHLISVGLPFVLSLLIVGYRLRFDKPTWLEWGGLGYFTLAGLLTLMGDPGFAIWGLVVSQVVMGGLWLSSLVAFNMPLCGEYSKWGYNRKLWCISLFIHPNAAISLVWGWQFLVAALLGVGAVLFPERALMLTVARYALLIPCYIFTVKYQEGAENRPIADIDKALARMRFWAGVGLVVALGLSVIPHAIENP